MSTRAGRLLVVVLAALAVRAVPAGVLLDPPQASEWRCSEWINGDPGPLSGQRGKVVIVHFFQMWCPGSNEFSLPLLRQWEQRYADRPDVLLVSVHSVFEGHAAQTPELLRVFVADQRLHHPVCIDAYPHPGAETPLTMESYRAEGTPQLAIVDKVGNLRFSHFGVFDPGPVEFFINRLADDKGTSVGKTGSSKGKATETKPARSGKPAPRPTPPAAQSQPSNASLSGTYKVAIDQSAKSCGDLLPTIDVIAEVSVLEDRVEARFTRPLYGLTRIQAEYDARSQTFETTLTEQAKDKQTPLDLNLSFQGTFHDGTPEPTADFRFSLGMRSEDGTQDCAIEGQGTATRLRGR